MRDMKSESQAFFRLRTAGQGILRKPGWGNRPGSLAG